MNRSRFAYTEQDVAKLRKLNLFDDTLLSFVFRDKDACEHLVRVLMNNKTLRIKQNVTQKVYSNLLSRDVRLDILAVDNNGKEYEIEIQKKREEDPPKRLRYYAAVLDSEKLKKGIKSDQLPDLYFFYISKADIWSKGTTISKVVQGVGDLATPHVDGIHKYYVNAAVDDGSEIAKLMQYFKTADVNDNSQGAISNIVSKVKSCEGGSAIMDTVFKDIYNNGRLDGLEEGMLEKSLSTAKKLKSLKTMSDETIAQVTDLSLEQVKAIVA